MSEFREARNAITLRNAQQSPLLKLPAEIRNTINAYALLAPLSTYVFSAADGKEKHLGLDDHALALLAMSADDSEAKDPGIDRHTLALLAVSRQLHIETKALPFEVNTPSFESLAVFATVCNKMPPTTRSLIKSYIIKDITYKTVDSFIKSMADKEFGTLRQLLPNVRDVRFIALKKPGDWGTSGPWRMTRKSQMIERRRLVAWFEGSDGEVQVDMRLPKYGNGVVAPNGEIVKENAVENRWG